MDFAAILFMWSRCGVQNLAFISRAVSEEMFKLWMDGRWKDAGSWVYYKLTWWVCGSAELITFHVKHAVDLSDK